MGAIEGLAKAEFAFPGPVRERLVKAILDGQKTATASLHVEYEQPGAEGFPEIGAREVVVDSDGRPVAVIEFTAVTVLRVDEVDEDFARDEGEGFDSVEQWRRAHTHFWESDDYRATIARPDFQVGDDTPVVAIRFRLVEVLT